MRELSHSVKMLEVGNQQNLRDDLTGLELGLEGRGHSPDTALSFLLSFSQQHLGWYRSCLLTLSFTVLLDLTSVDPMVIYLHYDKR